MTIYLDLDGTVIDFYGVPNWLECLEAQDSTPYRVAKPLVHLSTLARYLNRLQARGYNIGIISWLSKSGTDKFNAEVAEVKREWLAKHLPQRQVGRNPHCTLWRSKVHLRHLPRVYLVR